MYLAYIIADLRPGEEWSLDGETYDPVIVDGEVISEGLIWHDVTAKPTEAELDTHEPTARSNKAYALLRAERLNRLQDTEKEGEGMSDRTMSGAMTTYRQDLRDLPSTETPDLDSGDNLINVTWPTKP